MRAWTTKHGPKVVLYVFCAAILVVAALYRGHSVDSMDVRTYAQMIRAISEHGLPYWENGPIDRFPELVVPWAVPAGGGHRLWGIYGILYPYLMAPIFKVGGIVAVQCATFAILAPLVYATFALASRLVKSPWYATAAALLATLSTPIMAKSIEITPFPLTALFATIAMLLAVQLIETRNPSPKIGFLCGATWAAGCASHALVFPMAFAGIGVLALAPDVGVVDLDSGLFDRLRTQVMIALERAAPAIAGFAIAILPSAWINHQRFSSWNPLSYGPIPWAGLVNQELHKMTFVEQLRYSAVPASFVLFVILTLLLTRKKKALMLSVFMSAVLIAVVIPGLRTKFIAYGVSACGYFIDMTYLDLGPLYSRFPGGGPGKLFSGWVAKTVLQCTPILILAPLAVQQAHKSKRWPLLVVLVPCVALLISFITRANLIPVDAIGWPWVYIRYTFAALPGLVVLAVVVLERIELRVEHALVTVVIGTLLTVFYVETRNDLLLFKRVVLLAGPLVFGVAALLLAFRVQYMETIAHPASVIVPRASRIVRVCARFAAAVSVGLGIAAALGHDLRANVDGKKYLDRRVNEINMVVPERFAMVGAVGDFDGSLTTTITHDVEYADILRLKHWTEIRPLLEYWRSQNRPIYFHFGRSGVDMVSPWPDVSFRRQAERTNFFLLEWRDEPDEIRSLDAPASP